MQINIKKCVIIILFLMVHTLFIYGDNSGYKFLRFGAGSRAISLGEAYVAMPGDISIMNYNPAGIGSIKGKELLLTHIKLLYDMEYEYLAYVNHFGSLGTLGINFKYLHYPKFEYIDIDGNNKGEIGAFDWAVTAGLGKGFKSTTFFEKNYIGVNLKLIHSVLEDYSYMSFAFDIGIININYLLNRKSSFGIALRNAGINLKKPGTQPMPLPVEVALGTSMELFKLEIHKALLSTETILDRDIFAAFKKTPIRNHLGMEYVFRGFLSVRACHKFGYISSGGSSIGM